MKLGKDKDTITFSSGVIILLIAIVTLAVIHPTRSAGSENLSSAIDTQPVAAMASPTKMKATPTDTAVSETEAPVSETPTGDVVETGITPGMTFYKMEYFVVRMPDGAIEDDSRVAVSLREPDILALAGQPGWKHILMANIDLTDTKHMLLPSNRFSAMVETCFELDEKTLADYVDDPTRYRVEIFNGEASPVTWEPLVTRAYPEQNLVCGITDTASLYALAIHTTDYTTSNSTP